MDLNIVIKQEPPDSEEEEGELDVTPTSLDPVVQIKTEKTSSKRSKSPKRTNSSKNKVHKKHKEKRSKHEAPTFLVKEEKARKVPKIEKEFYVEPPRAEVYPDLSMSDFYCKVCDAHMNSVQVWESHIQGKRHLKNIKKELSAPPPTIKKEVSGDTDLYYIDTRGAPSPSTHDDSKRSVSPAEPRQRGWYSPEPAAAPSTSATSSSYMSSRSHFDLSNVTMSDKIDYICKLSESVYPECESDFSEIKAIISAFSQSILQYKIRQLPFAVQQTKVGEQHYEEKACLHSEQLMPNLPVENQRHVRRHRVAKSKRKHLRLIALEMQLLETG